MEVKGEDESDRTGSRDQELCCAKQRIKMVTGKADLDKQWGFARHTEMTSFKTVPATPNLHLSAVPFRAMASNSTCPICLEDLPSTKTFLPCFHAFCPECIATWRKTSRACPTCKHLPEEAAASAPQETSEDDLGTQEEIQMARILELMYFRSWPATRGRTCQGRYLSGGRRNQLCGARVKRSSVLPYCGRHSRQAPHV